MLPAASNAEMIFYDGHCGLCHRAVRFALRHDRSGSRFRFAPLQGATFQSLVPADAQAGLPDSVVVLTQDGVLLVRSNAFLHILRRVGRRWGTVARVLAVVPRPLRDLFYNLVARIRYHVFGTRLDLCPVVPRHLRARFYP